MKRIKKIGIILLIFIVGFLVTISILYDGDFELFIVDMKGDLGPEVYASKLEEKPLNYLEINESELEKYPYVKEAVMNPGKGVRTPDPAIYHTTSEFSEILSQHEHNNMTGTGFIKFNQDYYRISMSYAT